MKKFNIVVLYLAGVLAFTSCSLDNKDYLYDQKDGDQAFTALADIKSGMNGAYYYLGQYEFLGNYAIALGDFAAGVSMGSSSSGHMYYISSFTFDDTDEEFDDSWNYGYKVITSATKTINGAKAILESGVVESDLPDMYNYMSQCYALKALSAYYLVNLYALPYSTANASTPGIVVIDETVPEAFQTVERSTVQQTYDQILKDLQSAEDYHDLAAEAYYNYNGYKMPAISSYYMGPKGIQALYARVYLSMGKYTEAEAAAKNAITLNGKGDGTETDVDPSNEAYISMWGNVAINSEDIFTIKKSDDDNLSANSLGTLYNSYYATIQNTVLAMFDDNDIRTGLFTASDGGGTTMIKYEGESSAAAANIRIFRKSEMSLIIAECEARAGNYDEAKKYIMYTAKRNPDLDKTTLANDKDDLLNFISEERVREFMGEGHRFYDARRMGDKITADNFSTPWDIQKFAFPITQSEINSGFGVTQNVGWEENLPTMAE